MRQHAKRRSEPLDLMGPLLDDAHRAHDERRAELLHLLPLGRDHRDRLHGLPEAHVVGQNRADAEIAEHPQPAVAALLERKERKGHRRRRRQRAEAPFVVGEQICERLVELHLTELETRLIGIESRHRAHELDDPGAAAATLEEPQRPLDLRLPQRVPAAGDAHVRILCLRQLEELALVE